MPNFRFNPDNTEGAWPTSIDFNEAEIKKNDKIVATDLPDLYDVEITDPIDGDNLKYEASTQLWKNAPGSGSSCTMFSGYNETLVDLYEYENAVHINNGIPIHPPGDAAPGATQPIGSISNAFLSLKECFEWLNYCRTIPDDITLTIYIHTNETIDEPTSLNHPQGYNIVIDALGNTITNEHDITFIDDTVAVPMEDEIIFLSKSKSDHTLIIRSDGTLWGSGHASNGELGIGPDNSINLHEFEKVGEDDDWAYVACGYLFSLAIKTDGTLWATGENGYYQLGLGHDDNVDVFTQVGEDEDWAEVACGYRHTLVRKTNGQVYGVGYGYYGQFGQGNNNSKTELGVVYTGAAKIACGYYHSGIIRSIDGEIVCTGRNYDGQIAMNSTTSVIYNWTFETRGYSWVDIDMSYNNTVAIKDDGTLWACGRNYYGQCGLGFESSTDTRLFTQEMHEYTDWINVSMGLYHLGAIRADGSVYTCGYNSSRQLGNAVESRHPDLRPTYNSENAVSIRCNSTNTVIIEKTSNLLYGVGFTSNGDTGVDREAYWLYGYSIVFTQSRKSIVITGPLEIETNLLIEKNHSIKEIKNCTFEHDLNYTSEEFEYDGKYVSVSSGNGFSIIVKEDGTMWTCGREMNGANGMPGIPSAEFGQTGNDTSDWVNTFVGYVHSTAIKENGTLWSTGFNYYGVLGIGTNGFGTNATQFTQEITNGTDWLKGDSGLYHTFAIKTDGTLWGCGSNSHGQLGLTSGTVLSNVFTQIGTDNDWIDVACGRYHTMAIKSDGTLWGTGNNTYAETGLSQPTAYWAFNQVGTDTDWWKVSAYAQYTMALKSTGTIWGTGRNAIGQMGITGGGDIYGFTQESREDEDWIDVSCYGNASATGVLSHTMALKEDGTLWGTGYNSVYGQLGLGEDSPDVDNFTQEITLSKEWAILGSGGSDTSLNIKTDGSLWGAGVNNSRQLGLPSSLPKYTFTHSQGGILLNGSPITDYEQWIYEHEYYHTRLGEISNLTLTNVTLIDNGTEIIVLYDDVSDWYYVFYLYGNSILNENMSNLYINDAYLDKIKTSASSIRVNNVLSNVDWKLYNDSILVIDQNPSIAPTLDIQDSTYIIDGVIQ